MINRKTPAQLDLMAAAGQVHARCMKLLASKIRPGVTTAELDEAAEKFIRSQGGIPTFKGFRGFPGSICASPNSMVVHGIPSDEVVLREGDIVSIDCGAVVDGWHGDAAFTAPVGDVSMEARHLIEVADASLDAAIAVMVAGNHLGDIGHAVESVARAAGLSVVEGYTGHAIGRAMHESPNVPNVGRPGGGARLRVGNVLAVEPMLVVGEPHTDVLDDEWSVVTADGSWAAHVEHTIAITERGPEVLTRP